TGGWIVRIRKRAAAHEGSSKEDCEKRSMLRVQRSAFPVLPIACLAFQHNWPPQNCRVFRKLSGGPGKSPRGACPLPDTPCRNDHRPLPPSVQFFIPV